MAKRMFVIAAAIIVGLVIAIFAGSENDVRSPKLESSPASVPEMINYQGVLTDGEGNPLNTTVEMTFAIYDAASGGTALWSETHPSVQVNGGLFNVLLGSVNPISSDIFDGSDRWLGLAVDDDPEMVPRQQIASVPYAYLSGDAGDGHSLDAADGDPVDVVYVDEEGNVGFGTTGPEAKLHVSGGPADIARFTTTWGDIAVHGNNPDGALLATGDDAKSIGMSTGNNYASANGRVSLKLTGGGGVAEAGSFNFLGDSGSIMFINSGGDVGIGTTSPGEKLDVGGIVKMTGFEMSTGASSGYVLTSDAQGTGTWQPVASGGDAWSLSGNSGTDPATNFLGTTDDQALEFRVNNERALRLELETGSPNVIGGYSGNVAEDPEPGGMHVSGATISGGGSNGSRNIVLANYGTVSGGSGNTAGTPLGMGPYCTVGGGSGNKAIGYGGSTVSGGLNNEAAGQAPTVGGGEQNTASGFWCTTAGGHDNDAMGQAGTIGGGEQNSVTGWYSTISGGSGNTASGKYATVPGGHENTALGNSSFAAGWRAKANHRGTFIWADSTNEDFTSTGPDQFLIRASGGVGIGTNNPEAGLHVKSPEACVLKVTSTGAEAGICFSQSDDSKGMIGYGDICGGGSLNALTI